MKSLHINLNIATKTEVDFDLEDFIYRVLKNLKIKKGSFDFNFVDNLFISQINKKYLKKNHPTDVITFNLADPTEALLGDIYISSEQAKINALEFDNDFSKEIKLLLVHAILHLLDWRDYDQSEKEKMRQEENRILTLIDLEGVNNEN
jgi:probable rRNA maturation factor